jgi:hypothetical protein
MPEDGTIRFADDIYRHDVTLDRALAKRHVSPPATQGILPGTRQSS